jgi:hypothetical protein
MAKAKLHALSENVKYKIGKRMAHYRQVMKFGIEGK